MGLMLTAMDKFGNIVIADEQWNSDQFEVIDGVDILICGNRVKHPDNYIDDIETEF